LKVSEIIKFRNLWRAKVIETTDKNSEVEGDYVASPSETKLKRKETRR
jgi:hypothetical protein